MRKTLQLLVLVFGIGGPHVSWGQTDSTTGFEPLLRRFSRHRYENTLVKPTPFAPPIVYRDSTLDANKHRQLNLEIRLAAQPLGLAHRVVRLVEHGYPVAYSVVFQGCLVALFKHGRFGCYRLPDLAPDEQMARQLNVANWQRFWLIGEKLVGQTNDGYYAYNAATHDWSHYEAIVPFGKQPKLYEDDRYLAYATCNGEFGGIAYFYDKLNNRTYRANATCANTLWQEGTTYRMLVSLGHGFGSAASATIADPAALAPASAKPNYNADWQYSFRGAEAGITKIFDFYGLQLFAALPRQPQTLYLIHWRSTTFLATIDGKRITIVDPLFANNLYTHDPITTTYGPDLALTNLDFYGLGGSDEIAALLWQGQQVTKVEWGEQPDEQR